ncbi:hypothetical protein PAPYR_8419 [Paratrimastix pyriformis]|uniref:Uncharacterized protein n=1 Tax=Paratrimastix pyriformis TaxID=342808 RepID=A0ABQ8UGC3_9EUKA|nr:hypothetical protein PAPYR_8419 [Paratrimastix pyriformis]
MPLATPQQQSVTTPNSVRELAAPEGQAADPSQMSPASIQREVEILERQLRQLEMSQQQQQQQQHEQPEREQEPDDSAPQAFDAALPPASQAPPVSDQDQGAALTLQDA